MVSVNVGQPVLKLENLAIAYGTRTEDVHAVRNVSFEIYRGKTFGLVGESGCGKSTTAFAIVGFLGRNGRVTNGSITFQGEEIVGRSEQELQKLRGNQISMVYQDPMQALNPALTIGDQLTEVLTTHQKISKQGAVERVHGMLERVYMPNPGAMMRRYPHQISGGQQQRAVIAMALLNDPALLIMDEPTTALDVTIEAAVIDLINDLRKDFDTAILFISHNLGLIARVCDDVGVMYAGELVERASVREIYAHSSHPYTQGLLKCVPKLTGGKDSEVLVPVRGSVPPPNALPPGCVFEPRCDYAMPVCRESRPDLVEVAPDHTARCTLVWQDADGNGQRSAAFREVTAARNVDGAEHILEITNLRTYYEHDDRSLASMFGLRDKQYVKAVDDVTFELPKGVTLGIVGESGCGKSTLAKTVIGLESPSGGTMAFQGIDINKPIEKRSFENLRSIQMVFQNPDATLNPAYTVGYQISRPLKRFTDLSDEAIKAEAIHLLESVRLDASYYDRMPSQLSGGEKQRVAIARAIAARPDLIVCDEPVSSLDVSVQATILNLLLDLQKEYDITIVFISHDLSVVRFFSDYVAVMYLGRICEIGPAESIYVPPYHPYTEALLSAIPMPDPTVSQRRMRLKGAVPSALNPPEGCRFNTRCPRAVDGVCNVVEPVGQDIGDGHFIFCNRSADELRAQKTVIKFV